MDERGFKELLAELDDETVREMLIHVSANSPDAIALIVANLSQREGAGKQRSGGSRDDPGAGPAVAGPSATVGSRLWRSFSHEELVSESLMAEVETGEVAASTSLTKAVASRFSGDQGTPARGSASGPASRSGSNTSDLGDLPRSNSTGGMLDTPRRGSGTKWWKFGTGRRSKDDSKPSKRKASKSAA
eukprot:m.74975 g.74975  ORF g.74975 m.74975 type:complete len:188 (+) comp10366_c0_seq2:802-1365(+)